MPYTVRVIFDNGDVRWLIELTNGLMGKWTNSPFGAKSFEYERDAQATAQNLSNRADVANARVEAWPTESAEER